ncbi:MAG TPA: hypothetical protein VJZ27_07265, partial [Aggregatilineales bacterium]|nr:hypothetical protein [Aggregatilineales bacterium]
MKRNSYFLLSLGCSKNTVDSESMAQVLDGGGFRGTEDPSQAEILIVNTCGFIHDAKQQSVDSLQELADMKKPDQ